MPRKLRIALIGTGGIMRGAHMNPGWRAIPECEVVAVCDIRKDVAVKFATDFEIPHAFDDIKDLLRSVEIDAVDIATSNRSHTPIVLAALAAGKHVLCEKPLAVSVAELRRMAAAVEKSGTVLMSTQTQRYSGAGIAIKRFVNEDTVGEVYHSRVHAVRRNLMPGAPGFLDEKLSGGGPCMDIGVHALDMALWLMDWPRPVRATGRTMLNFAKGYDIPGGWGEWDRDLVSVEDFASGFIQFENGATMVLESCWLQHQKETQDFSVQLFGRKGGIKWPSGDYATAVNRVLTDTVVQPVVARQLRSPHTEAIADFVDAVLNHKPSPVPVTETINVIAILEAIYRSSKIGREVKVRLPE